MDEAACAGVEAQFRIAVQALALAPDEQIRVTQPGCVTCELYEDFHSFFSPFLDCRASSLNDSQKSRLDELYTVLKSMPADSTVCWDESVLLLEPWAEVRTLALAAMKELAWKQVDAPVYKERFGQAYGSGPGKSG